MSAAQIGWVATNAMEEETLVKDKDGIQVAKCKPSSTPASTVRRTS